VESYQGKSISVELVQSGSPRTSRVEWRGIALVDQHPALYRIFDEEEAFIDALSEGEADLQIDQKDAEHGSVSLRVHGRDRENAAVPRMALPIRENPGPGEYRFLRFAWKKQGGSRIALHLAREGQFPAADGTVIADGLRYQAGRAESDDYGPAIVLGKEPPGQWQVVTRDLFADFGEFTLTGLRLVCGDGEAAWFDRISLARRVADFERPANKTSHRTTGRPADVAKNADAIAVESARSGDVVSER
jgi:hypothetical protein